MKTKHLVCVMAAMLGVLGYSMTSNPTSQIEILQLNDVEAVAVCELPDGYSPNGHCVSNDRNEHFCSSEKGYKDCYQ